MIYERILVALLLNYIVRGDPGDSLPSCLLANSITVA